MSFFPRLRFRKGSGPTYTRPRMRLSDSDGLYGLTARLSDNSDGDEVIVQLENTRFLIVEESDGVPVAIDVRRMRVPNGTLTDLGGGLINFAPSGGGGNHNILSATHLDVWAADTPINSDVLTWDATNSRWEAKPAPAGGGSSGADNNEDKASVLINATSTGDAGSRADHFLGTSLGGAWTQEATAPASTVVKNSDFGIVAAAGGPTHYMRTYTPSGAFRIEARMISLGSVGTTTGDIGLLVRDSGSGDATGEGVLAILGAGSNNIVAYTLDAGTYTLRGSSGEAVNGNFLYLAIERDGSNNWSWYYSWDRSLWIAIVTGHAKTFTVAKMGFRVFTSRRGATDFIDVVS